MAIYKNAKVVIGTLDISNSIRSLSYNESAEEQDDSAMGDTTRSSAGGLLRWTIEGEGNQAFSTAFDQAFATKVGTTVACKWQPENIATATAGTAANPAYSGTGLITEYVPMTGSVGDQAIGTFSIVSAGTRTRTIA